MSFVRENSIANRRRRRPTAELLEDRLAPSGSGWSVLGANNQPNAQDAASGYIQQAKLTSPTPGTDINYGWGISLTSDGQTLAVGTPGGGPDSVPGSVVIYARSDRAWTETAELQSPAGIATDRFGGGVAISGDGNTLAVSARQGEWPHGPAELYVYARSGTDWNLTQTLTMDDGNGFGGWLSISDDGGVIAGGAEHADSARGAVYVFSRTNGVYTQAPPITPPVGQPSDFFGSSVALSGDGLTIASGASRNATDNAGSGVVYIYQQSGGVWTLATTLSAPPQSRIGSTTALNGDGSVLLADGSIYEDGDFVETVRVFNKSGSDWTQSAELVADDPTAGSSFGQALSLSPDGASAVVGAWNATVAGAAGQGAAYVFKLDGSTWAKTNKLTASDGGTWDRFGTQVAIRGGTIAIAAPQASIGLQPIQGAVYLFDEPQGFAVNVDPLSQTAYSALRMTFTASATSASSYSSQWQVSTDEGATWTDIAGATTPWYSFVPALTDSGNQYRAVFTNDADLSITTNPATLTVVKATPVITITPSQNPITPGAPLTIQVGLTSDLLGARQPVLGNLTLAFGTQNQSTLLYENPMSFSIPMGMLPGVYTVTASYDGTNDPVFGSAVATTTQVIVKASSSIEGSVSATTATVGQTVTLTGVVAATGGIEPPFGRVLFTDNGQPIGFGEILSTYPPTPRIATFTTAPLTEGGHYYQMVYLGDFETYASASGVYHVQVVPKTFTTTTLTSSLNPFDTGETVTFTASVVDSTDPDHPTSGAVDFLIGGVLVWSSAVDSDGVATLITNALVPGTYTVVARYQGLSPYQTSQSAPLMQTVSPGAVTTTTLTSSLNPSLYGDEVTFTATVATADGTVHPGVGSVVFSIGVPIVSVPVDANGRATLTTTMLSGGYHQVQAAYQGATHFAPSQSATISQGVNTTTTVLTSDRNPSTSGDTVTFTAAVAWGTGSGHPDAGVVDYYIGSLLVASIPIDGDGKAVLVTNALVPGDYTIIAVFKRMKNVAEGSISNTLYQRVLATQIFAAKTSTIVAPAPASIPRPAATAPASRASRFQAMRSEIIAARPAQTSTRVVPQRLITAHRWR